MSSSHGNGIFTSESEESETEYYTRRSLSPHQSDQQVTDDENALLSGQSSPSPFGSSPAASSSNESESEELSSAEQNIDEEEEEEQEEQQQHQQQQDSNYLDPDLYCLRRSNRQKDKTSVTVSNKTATNNYVHIY